jgi:anti-sigma factor RsiW
VSCSPFDLRDFFLKELPETEQRQVEAHLHGCAACREELDRLRLTEAALFTLRDEEIPQRIAFVSDKIFEPSPWRRWWMEFWSSAARLGFASAAMLSAAVVFFALTRPAPAPVPAAAAMKTISETEIQQRIGSAVEKAVAESEARQNARTEKLIAAIETRDRRERNSLMLQATNTFDYLERQDNMFQRAAYGYDSPRQGGLK